MKTWVHIMALCLREQEMWQSGHTTGKAAITDVICTILNVYTSWWGMYVCSYLIVLNAVVAFKNTILNIWANKLTGLKKFKFR